MTWAISPVAENVLQDYYNAEPSLEDRQKTN